VIGEDARADEQQCDDGHRTRVIQHGAERSLVALGEAVDAGADARQNTPSTRRPRIPRFTRNDILLRILRRQELLAQERNDRERQHQRHQHRDRQRDRQRVEELTFHTREQA
jgi:hypothetical protein